MVAVVAAAVVTAGIMVVAIVGRGGATDGALNGSGDGGAEDGESMVHATVRQMQTQSKMCNRFGSVRVLG